MSNVPEDDGEKLATISRGPNRELRIRWRTFNGSPFCDLREWSVNPRNAQWWPERGRGITIKARELEQVIDALEDAREHAQRSPLKSEGGVRGPRMDGLTG